jgi:hypothetical protein
VQDRPLSILLFCDDNPNHASMILDHIEALVRLSRHQFHVFNSIYHPGHEALDLHEFDVVVIHYSLFAAGDAYLSPTFRRKIRDFGGLKIQLIQDDYRAVDALAETMRFMGIDVLFTLVPESEHAKIWHGRLPGVELITWIAGYIPDRLIGLDTPPLAARPIEVGYRGREMPYWLGALAREKVEVGKGFLERANRFGLRCDISWREEDRLYGDAWDRFNARCRTMLGCGSGASIADFDGGCERAVRAYLREHPGADFDEVAEQVLRPWEGNIDLNVISPRQFEAVAARTALVLFPSDYSGILQPEVHFIPLAKDFSNIDAVAARIRDIPYLEAMTARAYNDVIASGRYAYPAFVREFDAVVDRCRKPDHIALPTKRSYRRMCWSPLPMATAFLWRAVHAVHAGQPVRLSMRVKTRRYIWTVPGYWLQKLGLRALKSAWHTYTKVRDKLARIVANRRAYHRENEPRRSLKGALVSQQTYDK